MRARCLLGAGLFLAGLGAAGCGGGAVPSACVRLSDSPGTLQARAHAAAVPELSQEFESVPEDWHVITGTKDVLAVQKEALVRTIGHEAGRDFLTLAGSGATYTTLAVQGDTPYLFEGTLRARGIAPGKEPFHGAIFWVAESSIAAGTPRELFGGGRRFDLMHPLPSVWDQTGWQERRVAFRTQPGTRTLIMGCVLEVEEPLAAGEMDFDRLRLARISEEELWELRAAEAVAEAHRGRALPPAGDWRARRRVAAMLAAEERPALLLLPGESLAFELDVPEAQPRFTCGLGPWPRVHRLPSAPLVHWVRVDGRELLRESHAPAALANTGWREVSLDLAPFAGRRVRLELGLEGALPGVFGAPQVRARGAPAAGWNVLLVSIDTLRADRVGAYGATSGATPRLDALAKSGILFEDVTANAPYTLPAHATLFSGQFPSVHGVEDRGRLLAPLRSPVLAQVFAERGYRTQAFAAGGFMSPDFGFAAGFDGFSIADPLRHTGSGYFDELRREYPDQAQPELLAEPGVERVRRWLATHAEEPFFLFLHTYEVHDYDPPPGPLQCAAQGCTSGLRDYRQLLFPKAQQPFPGTPEERTHLGHLYDAALAHVDWQLGQLFDELARLGLTERTLVLVTSDHGEELFERGHLQHGKTLYDEVLRVPWILSIPGREPARLRVPAMQVDMAPTLLGALGLEPDARMQGLDLLRGTPRARPLWSEVDDHFVQKSSLRQGGWKLLHGPLAADVRIPNAREWELYDLAADPGEGRDLAAREPERLHALQREFEAFAEHLRSTSEALGPPPAAGALDESMTRLLEALGYGGGK